MTLGRLRTAFWQLWASPIPYALELTVLGVLWAATAYWSPT